MAQNCVAAIHSNLLPPYPLPRRLIASVDAVAPSESWSALFAFDSCTVFAAC